MTNELLFDSKQVFENTETPKTKNFKGLFLVGLTGTSVVLKSHC